MCEIGQAPSITYLQNFIRTGSTICEVSVCSVLVRAASLPLSDEVACKGRRRLVVACR